MFCGPWSSGWWAGEGSAGGRGSGEGWRQQLGLTWPRREVSLGADGAVSGDGDRGGASWCGRGRAESRITHVPLGRSEPDPLSQGEKRREPMGKEMMVEGRKSRPD